MRRRELLSAVIIGILAILLMSACESSIITSAIDVDSVNEVVEVAAGDVLAPADEHSRLDGIGDLFDRTRVVEIELFLAPDDWDFIRFQTRDIMALLGGEDCMEEPFGSPFTYVNALVRIDGVVIEDVGLRKKGFFGSLDHEKPSLKTNSISMSTVLRCRGMNG